MGCIQQYFSLGEGGGQVNTLCVFHPRQEGCTQARSRICGASTYSLQASKKIQRFRLLQQASTKNQYQPRYNYCLSFAFCEHSYNIRIAPVSFYRVHFLTQFPCICRVLSSFLKLPTQ
ncbi:hypothetical protein FGO68_gene17453 [Halteria grandinella]|uniref:Uncharacterized protein n=1 Tax=Halteria grandinella TaxID=5974 RepID=A0A8J8NGU8_HALGN|nr:hypothetical protein FGO68_gene17453 [Halteria grandinella]